MKLSNPYRSGAYHFTVETLIEIGINKSIRYSEFAAKLPKVWAKADAEGWKEFANRSPRNKKTGKDLAGRVLQNCKVLQRIKDYAKPLLTAGAVLDLFWGDKRTGTEGQLMIMLNTHSKKPETPGRLKKETAPKAVKAVKTARKPSKAVKVASKAASPLLSGSDAVAFLRKSGKKKAAK